MRNLIPYRRMVVTDRKSGAVVSDTGRLESHSFTKNFALMMFNLLMELARWNITAMTNTSNVSKTAATDLSVLTSQRMDASASDTAYGIQVGSGTTAESISDYALDTLIADGISAGELQYGTMIFGAAATDATTTTITYTRVFSNDSGGNVDVEEIGLVSGSGSNRWLWIRDLTGTQTVGNGQDISVNYELVTTI